jgi:hypothetical protein
MSIHGDVDNGSLDEAVSNSAAYPDGRQTWRYANVGTTMVSMKK